MLNLKLIGFFVFIIVSVNLLADDIVGFWETIDKRTKKPNSVIAVYPYQGKFYGRIIATYNKQGVMDDTIYHPKDRAPGIVGTPYYSGIDILWDVSSQENDEYKGHIIDPKEGKIYKAELWREGENLILRGEVFIFGRNELWPPFPESNFTEEFKKPDLSTFVPKKVELMR